MDGDVWAFLVAAAKRDSDNGAALREALRQLEPEVVKKLLLRHARSCTNPNCTTCKKLRQRIDSVKRKRQLWRRFRVIVKVAGRLIVLRGAAAERAYAPGNAGYERALESFNATGIELLDMDEFAIYLQDVYVASDQDATTELPPAKEQEQNTELPPGKRIRINERMVH